MLKMTEKRCNHVVDQVGNNMSCTEYAMNRVKNDDFVPDGF